MGDYVPIGKDLYVKRDRIMSARIEDGRNGNYYNSSDVNYRVVLYADFNESGSNRMESRNRRFIVSLCQTYEQAKNDLDKLMMKIDPSAVASSNDEQAREEALTSHTEVSPKRWFCKGE